MRARLAILGAVAAATLPACADDRCDPDVEECADGAGGAAHEGPVALEQLAAGCSDDVRWVDAVLLGKAASTSLELAAFTDDNTVLWSERHAVPVAAADDAGWWEDRYLELSVASQRQCETRADCADRYDNGVSTLFACDDDDVTATVRVTDDEDRSVKTCATWGARTDLVEGCEIWEMP